LRLAHFARGAIDDADGLAGVVDEALIARLVVLAQHQVLGGKPAAVLLAEGAVLKTVGMLRLVLLPQQPPRHTGAFEFRLQPREIERHEAREGQLALIEPLVERSLIEVGGQRPGKARRATAAQTFLHRGAGASDRTGDLPVA
jgi:hypothetical protein